MNKLIKIGIGLGIGFIIIEIISKIFGLYDTALIFITLVAAVLIFITAGICSKRVDSPWNTFYMFSPIIGGIVAVIFWRPLIYGVVPEIFIFIVISIIDLIVRKKR